MPGSRMPETSGTGARSVTSGEVARCRAEPGLGQDPADRALTGSMARAGQLALDPAVSPARVLPGQVQDQITDLG